MNLYRDFADTRLFISEHLRIVNNEQPEKGRDGKPLDFIAVDGKVLATGIPISVGDSSVQVEGFGLILFVNLGAIRDPEMAKSN